MDGTDQEALFNVPSGVVVAGDGVLYVTDAYNHRIRKLKLKTDGAVPNHQEATVTLDLNPGITIKGLKGKRYRIESAENLESPAWITLGTITLEEDVQKWFDPRPSSAGKRLYRAVLME